MELEQITTKPIAGKLIYDTITTNFEGKNTYDWSVPCEWAQYKLYKNAWIVGIGPSKPKLWLIELEQMTTKPIAWTLIYDTITTNFEGKTIMIYVFHVNELNTSYIKKYLNCWNWTFHTNVMANGTWTNHNQANCREVNLWYDHDKFWGEKHFWFKCAMWKSWLQAT